MSATAAAILAYNAVPVFVDIDPENFCLDPKKIEAAITERTRAIFVVHLFGNCADVKEIIRIARAHNLKVIEDAAQAPGSSIDGKYVGSFGDIGVFSLNYHKTIHSGEGGIVVTDNDDLAMRVKLIRNHAEVVIPDMPQKPDLNNMLGFNYRMTEIEAAITREQLKKLKGLVAAKLEIGEQLHAAFEGIPFLKTHRPKKGTVPGNYIFPITYDPIAAQVPRSRVVQAIQAEGIPVSQAYVKPIYWQPLYQQRILFGGTKMPFEYGNFKSTVSYKKGICPVTEKLHEQEIIFHRLIHPPMTKQDINDIAAAFKKVIDNIDELRD
jgi:dTDP-4-amino-4,6-dideoxygalactose transaminase